MATEKLVFEGFDAVKLTFNNYITTIVYGRGCNIIELLDTNHNVSLLHYPTAEEVPEFLTAPQRFGCAPLFFPNKIVSGKFTRDGILYDLEGNGLPFAHGIIKEVPFVLEECSESDNGIYIKCSFNSVDTPYYKAFKWLFTCTFEYNLSQNGLSQTISFHNIGDVDFPFGVGYHTAFQIPSSEDSKPEDYMVMVTADAMWETNDLIPTGNLINLPRDYEAGFDNPLCEPISEHLHATDFDGFHGSIITNTKTGLQVIYETDPLFTQWMIWNNKASKNYICIEPMTWTIDAPNATFSDKKSGFQYLSAGQTWSATNRIYCK